MSATIGVLASAVAAFVLFAAGAVLGYVLCALDRDPCAACVAKVDAAERELATWKARARDLRNDLARVRGEPTRSVPVVPPGAR